jgi:magnesium transporter
VQVYLRDVHDHVVQLLDLLETCRELSNGLLELHMSTVSFRLNEVMKFLTIIATIFIPLTFVVGVYGLNFKWMPELEEWWAYPACLGVMAAIAATMLWWFRRRQWI